MSKHQKRILSSALLVVAMAVTTTALISNRRARNSAAAAARFSNTQNSQPRSANRAILVRRGLLGPHLPWKLNALGNRLEKPGRERVSLIGTLSRAGETRPRGFAAILEFPDRLRLTIADGAATRVIFFDGEQAMSAGTPLISDDGDLIETLVYDTAEHFFMTQMQGKATRFLGARFRMDDGSDSNYNGPYHDIYQVVDQIKTSTPQREQAKLYYFNSDTLLLERVSYQMDRDGSTVKIEEVISDWQKEEGQQVARRLERFENGKSVSVLSVRSVGLGPRADDGVFAN